MALLAVGLAAWLGTVAVRAQESAETYWFDPHTGIAIGGFDPLSYVVDGKPLPGKREHELEWMGLTWRFLNEGNRAAFADAPHVYAPRFGGFDPVALSRGVLVEGDPMVWTIHDGRLTFFYSLNYQAIWRTEVERYMASAKANWPGLRSRLPTWPGRR